jgi:hypothetical protein
MEAPDEHKSWKPREIVDRHKPDDIRYWSERFRISEDELREAVAEIGPRTAALATRFAYVVPVEELGA